MKKKDKSKKEKRSKKKRILEINSREMKLNLDKLQEEIKDAYKRMKNLLPETIGSAEIKSFGNASHIILPKKYQGKKATVIIKK